jgi:hypothetical protein
MKELDFRPLYDEHVTFLNSDVAAAAEYIARWRASHLGRAAEAQTR